MNTLTNWLLAIPLAFLLGALGIALDGEEQILKALADGDELEAGHILARIRKQVICRYASQACYGNSTTIQPE